jgi:hypothetical protein
MPVAFYNTLCTVPIGTNETQWCIQNYNSTSCSAIRENAQTKALWSLHRFYDFTALWALLQAGLVSTTCMASLADLPSELLGTHGVFLLLAQLLLAIHSLENIISKPLVQKSREANVPGWLSVPCIGCLALGGFLTFSPQSSLSSGYTAKDTVAWLIGPLYLATGGCFVAAAILGSYISNVSILSTMDKRRKLGAVYLFTAGMVILVILLLGICGISIGYILKLSRFPISDAIRGDFACNSDNLGGCTQCELDANRCPEWTSKDVTSILKTQAKASACVAAIFVCYCFSSIRFGFVMMNRISMYQIAFV